MLEFLFQQVFELATYSIGYLVLWCITFGRLKVPSECDDLAFIIGLLFWIAVSAGIWFVFFR